MKKIFMLALIVGLIIGGYNCNRSTDKTNEGLGIEESESALDPMEKEIVAEGEESAGLGEEDSGGDVDQSM